VENNSKFEVPEKQTFGCEDDATASNQHCLVLIFASARDSALGFG